MNRASLALHGEAKRNSGQVEDAVEELNSSHAGEETGKQAIIVFFSANARTNEVRD